MVNPRTLVYDTLHFAGPFRAPRQLWTLPWAVHRYEDEIRKIREEFPEDIIVSPELLSNPPEIIGNRYEPGLHVDAWGVRFVTIERGVAGEVKNPLISGESWEKADLLKLPKELLSVRKDAIRDFRARTDRFILAPGFIGPFERLQYLRGTEELFVDIALGTQEMKEILGRIHEFFCTYVDVWSSADVDGVWMLEDWGSQRSLLIHPRVWRDLFKPLYREYVSIAHGNGKKFFMHSDGHILDIMADLVEIGIDAVNAQLFCMRVENLRPYRGKITFWGEMDRQHLLPLGSVQDIWNAVAGIRDHLWDRGGCIAQCEFGVGARPENVRAVYDAWNRPEVLNG